MKKSLPVGFLLTSLALSIQSSMAQEENAEEQQSQAWEQMSLEDLVETVVVVGSRAAPRSVDSTPVPVDLIDGNEFRNQGSTDMLDQLSVLIPSLNVTRQPISDAATLIRPVNLRGLPPDSALILVNGKRRHRSAVISFLGHGISDGSHGPDLNPIPAIALKRAEVLRDGAAAQYGSDAISGVLNFVLKDDSSGGEFEVRRGTHYEGDGDATLYAGNIGLPFTQNGFANFSVEFQQSDPTDRSVQRDDAAALRAAGNTAVPDPAQIWGSPEILRDFKFFGNIGLELSDSSEAYLFGNVAERAVEGGFYYRNPNTRGGVFSNDDGQTLLVGDLTPNPDGSSSCPVVNIVDNRPDPAALAAVQADPDCFTFYEMLPAGFRPLFGGVITDGSIAMGSRGDLANDIRYDVSASVGRSEVEFRIKNTLNASLGPDTPTAFKPGKYVEIDKLFNVDVSKPWTTGFTYEPVNLAGGVEYREETFEIQAGDVKSFEIGPLASQGFGIGSNGFPGFKPEDAGSFSRAASSLYLDVEFPFLENFMVATAARYEDYEDFGTTTNGKIASRWEFTDGYALRAAASTGFRAPTTGQNNVRNVTTSFSTGRLADEATLPPTNPIAVRFGGKALEPEESVNLSAGFVMSTGQIYLTADYFRIQVKDRIGQTTVFELTDEDRAALVAQGVLDAVSFTGVRFFTNAFDTTTEGVDLVAYYQKELFGGNTRFALAFNWNETTVDKFDSAVINSTRVRQLEENLPKTKGSLTITHSHDPWRAMLRLNHFGSYYEAHLETDELPINEDSAITVDAELEYQFNDNFKFVVGAQNLTDEYPSENPWGGIVGSKYPETSPYGFNGGYYYARANLYF